MLRVADLLTYQGESFFPDADSADLGTVRETFVPTSETVDLCSRVLWRLSSFPTPQPGAFLITGRPGVGKTHLVRQIGGLLANPTDPAWNRLRYLVQDLNPPDRQLKVLRIDVPEDPDLNVGSFLIERLTGSDWAEAAAYFQEVEEADFTELIAEVAATLSTYSVGLLSLENISRRIDHCTDRGRLEVEIRFYKNLCEAFAAQGILVVLIADERHVRPDRGNALAAPLESLAKSCDFLWLSTRNVAQIITSAVARKDAKQRSEIRRIAEQLQRRFPLLELQGAPLADIYPIHPRTFEILFELRGILPGFSPLRFAQDAIKASLDRPADQLITVDSLFEQVLPELRKRPSCHPILSSYDGFSADALSQSPPSSQPKIKALLEAITLLNLCTPQPPSAKDLANALLLCDESEATPGYSLGTSLLLEMEQRGKKYLTAEGDKLERRYRLVPARVPPHRAPAADIVDQTEEFRRQLPLMIFDWIRSEIPSWQPEISLQYQVASQSIAVPYPDGADGATGLVFFKSVFDPLWSDADLVELQGSGYRWILLVLNPCERFYELADMLEKLPSSFAKLAVWWPASPSNSETARLIHLSNTSRLPVLHGIPEAAEVEAAKKESRDILSNLYYRQGRLVSARGSGPLFDESGATGLLNFLNDFLRTSVSSGVQGESGPPDHAAVGGYPGKEGEKETLQWASLLSGLDEILSMDQNAAAKRLKAWHDASFDPDTRLLSSELNPLPEFFLTTRFQKVILHYERHRELLSPVLQRLFSGAIGLGEAMDLIRRYFGNDKSQLEGWKTLEGNLLALIRWMPGFKTWRDYILRAFPVSTGELDTLRRHLLELMNQPHLFLQAVERDSFERSFTSFKAGYTEYYCPLHQKALQIVGGAETQDSKVDGAALRTLELLSGIRQTSQSYLHRVHTIGKWLQRNQCALPVREILDTHPRCHCNFNPDANLHLTQAAERINSIVQDGLEYYRSILRHCKMIIIEELESGISDDTSSRQIAALLGTGPIGTLTGRSIEIINGILEKHHTEFLSAIRSIAQ